MIVRRDPPKIRAWFWHLVGFVWMFVARMKFRIRVRHHGCPDPDAAVILCGKHASAFDIVLLGVSSRQRTRRLPFFQMGSFIGYRVFGRIKPFLRALGGFEVMRPKEVRRLSKIAGWDRSKAVDHMRAVNEGAEEIRRKILGSAGILAFFPEGTRDDARILPLVSELEVTSALAAAAAGSRVVVWPATVAMGPRGFRRRIDVDFGEPFDLDPSAEPAEVLELVEKAWRRTWREPKDVGRADV